MLTIMSFNIQNRYILDSLSKCFNSRMNRILKIIENESPDIIGLQEVTQKAKKVIEERFTQYNFIGRSRYNNDSMLDEYNLIMVNKKYKIITSGTYSLGSNVDKLSSKGFFDVFPRICSYVKLEYKGKIITIFNTHLDHLLNYNRYKQLKQINTIIKRQGAKANIVMGDFNLSRESELLKKFMNEDYKNASDELEQPTLRNRFIDHILFTEDFTLKNIHSGNKQEKEKYPSDHLPVIAKINLR